MTARLYKLTEIHQRIDEKLRREEKRPAPDSLELTRLKRMKLRVKDLMNRILPSASRA